MALPRVFVTPNVQVNRNEGSGLARSFALAR